MTVKGSITYTGMDGIKPASLRKAVKIELQAIANDWHDNTLKKHFARGARQRYGYKQRTDKYNNRKRKVKHHTRPLEYSGQLKRQLLRRARVSGTSKRATLSMDAPKYMYKYKIGQPDKAAEVTTVTQEEAQAMAVMLDKNLHIVLNQHNETTRVR